MHLVLNLAATIPITPAAITYNRQ